MAIGETAEHIALQQLDGFSLALEKPSQGQAVLDVLSLPQEVSAPEEVVPSPVSLVAGACPRCGSDILKRAPLPIVGPLLTPFTRQRRYRCRKCGWTGWKHRLHRRSSRLLTSRPRSGVEPRAAWFFVGVVVFLIIITVLLIRTRIENRPVEAPAGQAAGSVGLHGLIRESLVTPAGLGYWTK